MCLLLFAYRAHPDYPLVIAANRDEFHRRPAALADWWVDGDILAGRDLEAGGTWLGVNRRGHFAVITNYRDRDGPLPGARSRGELVVEALRTERDGQAQLHALDAEAEHYNGYNLVFGSSSGVFSYSNRSRAPDELAPGIYGLSNHLLETPWPKVRRGKAMLKAYLASGNPPALEPLIDLLGNREQAEADELPATGLEPSWERRLSAMFIVSPDYGTRASTAIVVDKSGMVGFMECTFGADGSRVSEREYRFRSTP